MKPETASDDRHGEEQHREENDQFAPRRVPPAPEHGHGDTEQEYRHEQGEGTHGWHAVDRQEHGIGAPRPYAGGKVIRVIVAADDRHQQGAKNNQRERDPNEPHR